MILAVFSSLNMINRMKRQIDKTEKHIEMVHTPMCISTGDSSFSLRFEENEISFIEDVSRKAQAEIQGLYWEQVVKGEKIYAKIFKKEEELKSGIS